MTTSASSIFGLSNSSISIQATAGSDIPANSFVGVSRSGQVQPVLPCSMKFSSIGGLTTGYLIHDILLSKTTEEILYLCSYAGTIYIAAVSAITGITTRQTFTVGYTTAGVSQYATMATTIIDATEVITVLYLNSSASNYLYAVGITFVGTNSFSLGTATLVRSVVGTCPDLGYIGGNSSYAYYLASGGNSGQVITIDSSKSITVGAAITAAWAVYGKLGYGSLTDEQFVVGNYTTNLYMYTFNPSTLDVTYESTCSATTGIGAEDALDAVTYGCFTLEDFGATARIVKITHESDTDSFYIQTYTYTKSSNTAVEETSTIIPIYDNTNTGGLTKFDKSWIDFGLAGTNEVFAAAVGTSTHMGLLFVNFVFDSSGNAYVSNYKSLPTYTDTDNYLLPTKVRITTDSSGQALLFINYDIKVSASLHSDYVSSFSARYASMYGYCVNAINEGDVGLVYLQGSASWTDSGGPYGSIFVSELGGLITNDLTLHDNYHAYVGEYLKEDRKLRNFARVSGSTVILVGAGEQMQLI